MATTNITLSDDNLLAEYIPLEKFKKVLEERLAVGPDTLAMLIRDGQIAEASAGAHFAIGGLWRTVKDAVAGRHALRLLIADLKPFQLMTSASSLTRDNVPVEGEFTIELQVNPEKPANVLGLMKEHSAVTKMSVLGRLAPHLGDRVLNSAVRRVDAVELRGNVGMQDKIQADAMKEVERIASDLGLLVRAVSLRWGFNDEEKVLIVKRQKEREQEALEREFKILNRQVERETESTVLRLGSDLQIEKAKTATEAELRQLVLSNELKFIDAREAGVRIEQMKALDHELSLNRTQRLDALKAQLEAEQQKIDIARKGLGLREVAREQEHGDRQHDVDLTKIGGERRDAEMDIVTRERKHDVGVTRIGGEKRDVELEIARRERLHDLEVRRITDQIAVIDRAAVDLDRRQAMSLKRLEELQELEIAAKAHEVRIRTTEDTNRAAIAAERERENIKRAADDAAHQREIALKKLADDTRLSQIQMLRDATPEQILAINSGFSAEVANVLIEQAKAKATEGTDRMAIMREMVQLAKDHNVTTVKQAQDLTGTTMNAVVGVAQGVGNAAAGRNRPEPAGADANAGEMVECPGPNCGRKIPVTARFCRHCGRQMRQ